VVTRSFPEESFREAFFREEMVREEINPVRYHLGMAKISRRAFGWVVGVLVAAGAGAGAWQVWMVQGPPPVEAKPPAPVDPRLALARQRVAELHWRLVQEKRYACCCAERCTLCLLERGGCSCEQTARESDAACVECLARFRQTLDAEGKAPDPAKPDLRTRALREAKVEVVKLKRLPDRDRAELDWSPGIREPSSPALRGLLEPELREAFVLLDELRREQRAAKPHALSDCCCSVGCLTCLLMRGSCGCGYTVSTPPETVGPRGIGLVRNPTACPECVRTWQVHPERGTRDWQPDKKKPERQKPKLDELRAEPSGVPNPNVPQ
jgi:hypothetical protein